MATSPRSACARFVDSSRRDTKYVAWNAAGRSNQLKGRGAVHRLHTRFAHIVGGRFNHVLARAGTESAWHLDHLFSLLLDDWQLKCSQTFPQVIIT
jgi:hypothetical protein